ncbi:hypothetical protein [Mycolicibacterium llatzerense]|uniref:hypothetical protein n=1 Tax=Mycolicibacterium llatzerense TaxID=280871 RepID=UPI0021B5A539|nr:hypothetical protein [Mycolicibacterium llatzerense]MCT7362764.1 hypothetical protein [Mycolicibacterium llatzerense]
MQQLQETNLAWSLIEAVKPELDARERNHVFISVGAGDAFTAVRILIKLIDTKGICLQTHLVKLCAAWLEAYQLHEDHAQLAALIDGIAVTAASLRTEPIVRALTRTRSSAALAIASSACLDRGVTARAG